MKISILTIGKPDHPGYSTLCNDYLGRIRHYAPVEHLYVRQIKGSRPVAEILAREQELLLAKIGRGEYCVALESGGESMDSLTFARYLERQLNSGRKSLLFCLGGAYGLGEGLRQRADHHLSLSKMTLAHELALTVLLEQLYRAFTILRGEGYHK